MRDKKLKSSKYKGLSEIIQFRMIHMDNKTSAHHCCIITQGGFKDRITTQYFQTQLFIHK